MTTLLVKIESMNWNDGAQRTKMTNAPDESGACWNHEGTWADGEGGREGGEGGRVHVCRQRIEFTTRFLRRPIVAGFNSDSFSTRHIKFMVCTVHITHPPQGGTRDDHWKDAEPPPPASLLLSPPLPISLFTLIFARPPERMNLSSLFPSSVLNIYDLNRFHPQFLPRHRTRLPPFPYSKRSVIERFLQELSRIRSYNNRELI